MAASKKRIGELSAARDNNGVRERWREALGVSETCHWRGLAKEVAALADIREEYVRDEGWEEFSLRRREVWILYDKIAML